MQIIHTGTTNVMVKYFKSKFLFDGHIFPFPILALYFSLFNHRSLSNGFSYRITIYRSLLQRTFLFKHSLRTAVYNLLNPGSHPI